MKYKILPDTATFLALSDLWSRIVATSDQIESLQTDVGATAIMVSPQVLAGGVNGFKMPDKPADWKTAYRHARQPVYFPRQMQRNRPLLDRIVAISAILPGSLNDIVGFKRQWKGLRQYTCPTVEFGADFHLMSVGEEADYTPNADMEELTVSEYKRLSALLGNENGPGTATATTPGQTDPGQGGTPPPVLFS